MNDMSPAGLGHNNPPDPIEVVIAEFDGTISEAQNWADGEPVSDEASMKSVDAVLKEFKKYKSALKDAAKERTEPLHKAWKAEVAAVKVYTDDADLMQKALVACVAPFKEQLAAEKREAERKAWEEAERLRKEAAAKVARANEADIEQQREAQAAKQAAMEAETAAKTVAKQAPKGMRTVTHHEVQDLRALVNWIAANDKPAMADFATAYASRNHAEIPNDIVRTWTTKEAF